MVKHKVIFVGGFANSTAKINGGQAFACTSLINSDLSGQVEWSLVNTIADMKNDRGLLSRGTSAWKRILSFLKKLVVNKPNTALIFSSFGLSLYEKGIMVLMAGFFGVKTIFAPRSGLIVGQVAQGGFAQWWLRLVVGRSTVVLCQSDYWRSYYQQFAGPSAKTTFFVVQNWLDMNNYPARKQPEKGVQKSVFRVLFLGRLDENKGVLDLIAAASLLKQQSPGFRIEIGGNGPLRERLDLLIQQEELSEQISLLGHVDEVGKQQLFQEVDAFILPSYAEGFPNALLEAMAVGLPCIASKVGSVNDIIKDGSNGLLITPGSPKTIAKAIAQLMNDAELKQSLGAAAQRQVSTNNTIENAVAQFRNLFSILMK